MLCRRVICSPASVVFRIQRDYYLPALLNYYFSDFRIIKFASNNTINVEPGLRITLKRFSVVVAANRNRLLGRFCGFPPFPLQKLNTSHELVRKCYNEFQIIILFFIFAPCCCILLTLLTQCVCLGTYDYVRICVCINLFVAFLKVGGYWWLNVKGHFLALILWILWILFIL